MKKYKGITTIETILVIAVIVIGCVGGGTLLVNKYPKILNNLKNKRNPLVDNRDYQKKTSDSTKTKPTRDIEYIPPFVLQPREKIDYIDVDIMWNGVKIKGGFLPDSIAKDPEKLKRFWKAHGKIVVVGFKNSLNPFDKLKKANPAYQRQLIDDFISRLQVGENDVCGSKDSEWVPEFFPDGCAGHDKNYGVYGISKSEADFNFYMDMLETAANSDFPLAAAAMANIYYHTVANIDATWDAYVDAQHEAYYEKYFTSNQENANNYGSGATCSIM
jgi:hypothetical protein